MWWCVLTRPWMYQAPVRAEGSPGRRLSAGGANAHDEAVVYRHPTASHFPAGVHRHHQIGARDDEVDRSRPSGCRGDVLVRSLR